MTVRQGPSPSVCCLLFTPYSVIGHRSSIPVRTAIAERVGLLGQLGGRGGRGGRGSGVRAWWRRIAQCAASRSALRAGPRCGFSDPSWRPPPTSTTADRYYDARPIAATSPAPDAMPMTTFRMPQRTRRLTASLRTVSAITATTGLLSALAFAGPAQAAALNCAPDAFEVDAMLAAAPIAVGGSLTRAICQDPSTGSDIDWFAFDAPGGVAYSAAITSGGSALNVGTLDGLEIAGVFRLNSDGTTTTIDSPGDPDFERFTTPVLEAGRYVFVTANHDEVAYPDFIMRLKTIEGSAGVYTVQLTQTAAAPAVASLSVPALRGNRNSTGTVTLSGPAPAGGTYVDFRVSGPPYISIARTWVPAGATRTNFTINVGRIAKDAAVTITAFTAVGGSKTATTTVKKG